VEIKSTNFSLSYQGILPVAPIGVDTDGSSALGIFSFRTIALEWLAGEKPYTVKCGNATKIFDQAFFP
jgi:hypothetical protein